jgi:hypothetical protein
VQRHPDAQKQHTKGGAESESTDRSNPGAQGLPMITDIRSRFVNSAHGSVGAIVWADGGCLDESANVRMS